MFVKEVCIEYIKVSFMQIVLNLVHTNSQQIVPVFHVKWDIRFLFMGKILDATLYMLMVVVLTITI